ncbi:MAG TPA: LptF/LptG family permease, partial [Phycisphaerae bacterium]|nr:LptF/LptG family permease [Phycisphaerae bacterium]
MRTLDRYVVRSFLSAAVMLFIAGLALRVVADLFFNMDEFVERNDKLGDLLRHVGTYYGYQSLMYFAELGGVIIVIASAFTLARMNHTNELTAMLASGVSLHRVILPMVVAAMCMGGLIILDRELLIPPNARYLIIDRDDQMEMSEFPVNLVADGNHTIWWSPLYTPGTGTMERPILTLRDPQRRRLASAVSNGVGRQAKFAGYRENVLARPQTLIGWDITATALSRAGGSAPPWQNTPSTQRVYTRVAPADLLAGAKALARQYDIPVPPDEQIPSVSGVPPAPDEHYNMTVATRAPGDVYELELGPFAPGRLRGGKLNRPVFVFKTNLGPDGRLLGIFHARSATWVPGESAAESHWLLQDGRFFFPTELTGDDLALRQSAHWLDLLSTAQLTKAMDRVPDRNAVLLARHVRFADPINNLVMLLLALPFILSRERNIKAAASLSLLMVGSYYA